MQGRAGENKCGTQRDRVKERIEKQEKELLAAQEQLAKEKATLAKHEERLCKLQERIDELSVPKPGQG